MKELAVILGHSHHVMRVLGKGHRENVYGKALQTSFQKAMIPFRAEVCCPIVFMDEIIGHGRADFVIGNYVVEIKANKSKPDEASDQLAKYLKSLCKIEKKHYIGVIINFNQSTGEVDFKEQASNYVKPPTTSRFFKKQRLV
jgi:GxxExxY protein